MIPASTRSRWPLAALVALAACAGETVEPASTATEATPIADDGDPDYEALAALGYVDFAEESASDGAADGVVLHDRARATGGAFLVTDIPAARAELIDVDGAPLHAWALEDADTLVRARLLPTGELLAIVKDRAAPGLAAGKTGEELRRDLRCLDAEGRELWSAGYRIHHDVRPTPGGEFVALGMELRESDRGVEGRFRDDLILRLAADGSVVQRLSLHALAVDAPDQLPLPPPPLRGDPYHSNSIHWLDLPELAAGHPLAGGERVLVSIRDLDTIAVVDLAAGAITWTWGPGELQRQHEALPLADGRILVFDNGSDRRPYSRVLIVDPLRGAIDWSYTAKPRRSFYSKSRGVAQMLPGGNVLIVESNDGRAFQVTPEGEIVWEYLTPHRDERGARAALRVEWVDPRTASAWR